MVAKFLKIENPGVAPKEAFTLLGASTKRNTNLIGKFGSGNKHGVAVCLRHGLAPVIFTGNVRLDFGTKPVKLKETEFSQVFVRYTGKDEGKTYNRTEDLGFVIEYGATDWLSPHLALREFISNALDQAHEMALNHDAGRLYWSDVVIEVVNENQVRAKSGTTRIFIPYTEVVKEFHDNLYKWFLHFSEPELLTKTILPKRNRNLGDNRTAVIYRRGVRVREITNTTPSVFDYNLEDLVLDEARNVDDWRVAAAAAQAISSATAEELLTLFESFKEGMHWEHSFQSWNMSTHWDENIRKKQEENWKTAFSSAFGEGAIATTKDNLLGVFAARKGFRSVEVPEEFAKSMKNFGIGTPETVLTFDEQKGQRVVEPTTTALTALDFIWKLVQKHNMTNGKEKPQIKCFYKIMDAESKLLGYYKDNTVFINTDICPSFSAMSQDLLTTVMEEVAHHVTGALDNSRDFQDFVLNLAVRIAFDNIL